MRRDKQGGPAGAVTPTRPSSKTGQRAVTKSAAFVHCMPAAGHRSTVDEREALRPRHTGRHLGILTIFLGACALYLGLTVVPALIVRATIWTWHVPYAGVPVCLAALVAGCYLAARWVWRSA